MLGFMCAYDKRMFKHMTWKPKDPIKLLAEVSKY